MAFVPNANQFITAQGLDTALTAYIATNPNPGGNNTLTDAAKLNIYQAMAAHVNARALVAITVAAPANTAQTTQAEFEYFFSALLAHAAAAGSSKKTKLNKVVTGPVTNSANAQVPVSINLADLYAKIPETFAHAANAATGLTAWTELVTPRQFFGCFADITPSAIRNWPLLKMQLVAKAKIDPRYRHVAFDWADRMTEQAYAALTPDERMAMDAVKQVLLTQKNSSAVTESTLVTGGIQSTSTGVLYMGARR